MVNGVFMDDAVDFVEKVALASAFWKRPSFLGTWRATVVGHIYQMMSRFYSVAM